MVKQCISNGKKKYYPVIKNAKNGLYMKFDTYYYLCKFLLVRQPKCCLSTTP